MSNNNSNNSNNSNNLSASMLASIRTEQELGVSLNFVRFVRDNVWDIRDREITSLFQSSAMLRLYSEQARSAIKDGLVHHRGLWYRVIYHNCDTSKLADKAIFPSALLSFRQPVEITGLAPTVLISASRKPINAIVKYDTEANGEATHE